MNLQLLERMALEYRRGQLTEGEVILPAFEVSKSKVSVLRSSMSKPAFEGLQQAARALMRTEGSDVRSIGFGSVTPDSPAQITDVPIEFISSLAAS